MDHQDFVLQTWNAITRSLSLALLLFFVAPSVCALDPGIYLSQYGHTVWRVREGYFASAPLAITQTKDGRLWIGDESGLVQFDGIRFVPWKPPDSTPLPGNGIVGLLGTGDGSLWIGTDKGLARWKDNQLTVYTKYGRFATLLEDRTGAVWAGHTRSLDMLPPLCRFAGDQFKCFSIPGKTPLLYVSKLEEDRFGKIWVGGADLVCQWKELNTECYKVPGYPARGQEVGVWALTGDSNGDLWVDGGTGGIWRLASGHWKRYELAGLQVQSQAMLFDRENTLWIGDPMNGLIRRVNGRTDRFSRADGFSGGTVNDIFEDREGSVWVATNAGLDRFRDMKVVSFTSREGLSLSVVDAVLASRDGSVWVSNGGAQSALAHIKDGEFTFYPAGSNGLPPARVNSLFEDSRGRLWVGTGIGIAWREHDRFHPIAMPKRCGTLGSVRAIAEDVDGTLWVSTTAPECRLVGVRGDRVIDPLLRQRSGEQIVSMAADPAGGVWLGTSGGLSLYRNGRFESHADKFSVRDMFLDSRGLWAATSQGLALYQAGSLTVFGSANGLPCDDLDSVVKDDGDALWLRGSCGLVQVSRTELDAWLKDPTSRFQLRVLDASDGAQAGQVPFSPKVTKSTDGRLWWAIVNGGVQVLDPKHFVNNPLPPPVRIVSVTADGKTYQLDSPLQLPPLTRDLEIQYTAYSLAVPEKVRFRYRLEGSESSWQDIGGRREAYFAKLKPGTYRFFVIAANNDGVWNDHGTSFTFVIPPAFYQTNWFLLLCIAGGLLAVWATYSLRVRQIARAISVRFDERLAERTRIARELHDTLLQTVQGSKLMADSALEKYDAGVPMRSALEKLSGWLGQATQEGRAALNSLRTSTAETNDLAAALRRAVDECQLGRSMAVRFLVAGKIKCLHPIARNEIYRIGYEAVRNACDHASASKLEIILTYAQDLTLRVRDNGIGMEAAVITEGREGHFGLQGMRERAESIGSKLTLKSTLNCGTEMILVVPGGVIFRKSTATLFERIKASFGLHTALRQKSNDF